VQFLKQKLVQESSYNNSKNQNRSCRFFFFCGNTLISGFKGKHMNLFSKVHKVLLKGIHPPASFRWD